jgi:hypothetical protein
MTKSKPTTRAFPCSFCGRFDGDPGIDAMCLGPALPDGTVVAICNSCAAMARSQIVGIRMQRMARMKGKRKT